ncbi:flagellar type III secretion system pore protein FliP [Afifella sp. IM 167]|uniref:flagellar type III secretion system pore protein FliP n=1 Tax=Afifella sp. IM 167 TaxID=2033586 RepID=UPI001CCB1899|nr:flagellar biosynthetic protein FliP [Afifella sp. IM 167]MBZ8131777.1 flagellar biosynthetic protein FliP [Afifella sp. IM 167]
MKSVLAGLALAFVMAGASHAQVVDDIASLIPAGDASAAGRIVQFVALITVLSVAPGLLIMVTSFTRFVIALSFLRSGLGLQGTPGNLVLISLALFMTFYVMGPTFDRAWQDGVKPLTDNAITEEEAFERITQPFREFMLTQVRPKDLQLFADLASNDAARPQPENAPAPETGGGADAPEAGAVEAVPLRVLVPAFMISELRRGFEIGFLIVLPFLVIDMIVATLVMSMGMMMMPPAVISLPFKILFFVLIDGWNLLVGGLVRSFF